MNFVSYSNDFFLFTSITISGTKRLRFFDKKARNLSDFLIFRIKNMQIAIFPMYFL